MLVAGVGGSGVITIGALLGMAAHLEGKGALVLDNTGLARKGGAVATHVRVARTSGELHAPRIGDAQADVLLACDLIVAASPAMLGAARPGHTQIVANSHPTLTAAQLADPDAQCDFGSLEAALAAAGAASVASVDATALAAALLGDSIYANLLLLGIAFQHGWLPVGAAALERAIELNGNAVGANLAAFRWGRLAAVDPDAVRAGAGPHLPAVRPEPTLDAVSSDARGFLVEYQDEAYAGRYRALVELAREAERARVGAEGAFTDAVARSYFKLLAYKDEYEVARLHALPEFRAALEREFEGDFRVAFHFAPPLFARAIRRRPPAQASLRPVDPAAARRAGAAALAARHAVRSLRVDRGATARARARRRIRGDRATPCGGAHPREPRGRHRTCRAATADPRLRGGEGARRCGSGGPRGRAARGGAGKLGSAGLRAFAGPTACRYRSRARRPRA